MIYTYQAPYRDPIFSDEFHLYFLPLSHISSFTVFNNTFIAPFDFKIISGKIAILSEFYGTPFMSTNAISQIKVDGVYISLGTIIEKGSVITAQQSYLKYVCRIV